jgi:hypothetical protein
MVVSLPFKTHSPLRRGRCDPDGTATAGWPRGAVAEQLAMGRTDSTTKQERRRAVAGSLPSCVQHTAALIVGCSATTRVDVRARVGAREVPAGYSCCVWGDPLPGRPSDAAATAGRRPSSAKTNSWLLPGASATRLEASPASEATVRCVDMVGTDPLRRFVPELEGSHCLARRPAHDAGWCRVVGEHEPDVAILIPRQACPVKLAVSEASRALAETAHHYQAREDSIRRCPLKKFPHGIMYELQEEPP